MMIPQQQPNSTNPNYVLIVGGCNGEYILQLPQQLELGQKNLAQSDWLIGGGGINQTLRLLKTDSSPLPIPILPVGYDDLGLKIREHLLREYYLAKAPQIVIEYLESKQFFVPNLSTRLSTIAIHAGERTIIAEKMKGMADFYGHLQERIEALNSYVELCSPNFSLEDFKQGIDRARIWAAYACCHVGGATNCPTSEELKVFQKQMLKISDEVLVLDRQSIKPVLRILERIYF